MKKIKTTMTLIIITTKTIGFFFPPLSNIALNSFTNPFATPLFCACLVACEMERGGGWARGGEGAAEVQSRRKSEEGEGIGPETRPSSIWKGNKRGK